MPLRSGRTYNDGVLANAEEPTTNEPDHPPEGVSGCPHCNQQVVKDENGLECESCIIWFHSQCQGMLQDEYTRLVNHPDERWICNSCREIENEVTQGIRWGKAKGHREISENLDKIYKEISSWRKNNFLIPRGKAGNEFVQELTRLLNLFNYKTKFEQHSISMAIIFTTIMSQKPSKNSKAKNNSEFLTKRLRQWKNQEFDKLLSEGKEIQKRLEKRI